MSETGHRVAALWQMLPPERRRAVLLALGRMIMDRMHGATLGEETGDDGRRPAGGGDRVCLRQDPEAPSRARRDCLCAAVDGATDRAPPGIDAAAICAGGPGVSFRVGAWQHHGDR